MHTFLLILAIAAVWTLLAFVVGGLFGRVVRAADHIARPAEQREDRWAA